MRLAQVQPWPQEPERVFPGPVRAWLPREQVSRPERELVSEREPALARVLAQEPEPVSAQAVAAAVAVAVAAAVAVAVAVVVAVVIPE